MPIIRSSRLYLCCYRIWCVCLGCWWSAVRCRAAGYEGSCSSSFPHPGRIAYCPASDHRPPATKALHMTCGNNTSIVSSSWWWAYKCSKHVERVISAINQSVSSSWFSSLLFCWRSCPTPTKIIMHILRSDDVDRALLVYCAGMCEVTLILILSRSWKKKSIKFNPVTANRRPLYWKTQSVPRCKHFSSRL